MNHHEDAQISAKPEKDEAILVGSRRNQGLA
jgi:hypothetical protein